jgi:gliding motility-associated-like protein
MGINANAQNFLKDNGFEINPSHSPQIDEFNRLTDSTKILCYGDINIYYYNKVLFGGGDEHSYVGYDLSVHKKSLNSYVRPFSPFPQGEKIMVLNYFKDLTVGPYTSIPVPRKVGISFKCKRKVVEGKKYYLRWYAFAVDTSKNVADSGFYTPYFGLMFNLMGLNMYGTPRETTRDSLCFGLSDTFTREGRVFHKILAAPNQWSRYETFFTADTTAWWFTVSNQGLMAGSNLLDDFKLFEIVHQQTGPAHVCRYDSTLLKPRYNVPLTSVVWSNGDTNAIRYVTDTGTYWVRYTDTLGMYIDTFNVVYGSDAHLSSAVKDTFVCKGNSISLKPFTYQTSWSRVWNNSDTSLTIQVGDTGWYRVKQVLDSCSSHIDSFHVTHPLLSAYPYFTDTLTCMDIPVTLFAYPQAGATRLWSNATQADTLLATDSGVYWVKTFLNGCSRTDSLTVRHEIKKTLNLPDTVICPGGHVVLDVSASGYLFYKWSTGDTTPFIDVNTMGVYSVKAKSIVCKSEDSSTVTLKIPPKLPLPADTSFCVGTSVALNAAHPFYTRYQWNVGDTTAQLIFSSPGSYYVNAQNSYCSTQQNILVKLYPVPSFSIEQLDTLCLELHDTVHLQVQQNFVAYHWINSGDTLPITKINARNYYVVTVTDGYGCSYRDSILPVSECEPYLYIPTAFSPNEDGLNDVFIAVSDHVQLFNMKIFNRWGELIFESNSITKGWNGKYKNMECPEGVYIWLLASDVQLSNGAIKHFAKKGTLTLFRKYE